ncbi:MAG TPA: hypothetical protein VGE32_07640 [Cellvibrio sp.]
MYKCAKKLMYLTFLVIAPALLSACGGAPADTTTPTQPSSTANKPDASSSSSSLEASSSLAASSTLSTPPKPSSSSKATSSAQSYSRISRASNSSSSQDTSTKLDTIPPEATRLELYRLSESSITLIWDDAFDNVAISYYKLERNGEYIATVEYPSHILSDQNLAAYTEYSYTITAFDLDGNNSEVSPVFTVRTLASPGGVSSMSSASSKSSNSSQSKSSSSSSTSSKSSISSSSKSSSNSSSKSSLSSSAKSSSSASSVALQTITITWSHPNQRENGTFLELEEIGGYEIRYRKPTDSRYTYITLNGNRTNEYAFTGNTLGLEFEIAVFDNRGLYSRFVKVGQ